MSYVYLLDLHQLIEKRITEAKRELDTIKSDPGEIQFHRGRIEALSDFKGFLTERLNPKLPRAFRKVHPVKKNRSG